jgi:hypothetical protein
METQGRLEAAIFELEELLDADHEPEQAFQAYFERHPVVLETMGYERSVAKPQLRTTTDSLYIPDFLAQPSNGPAEIVDLKTPSEQLLLKRERRKGFTASVNAYISQLEEYAELFDERTHREAYAAQYGLTIAADPAVMLVAGRDADTDKGELFRQQRRRSIPLTIRTFDDVRSALDADYARRFGVIDNLAGAGIGAVVRFDPEAPGQRIRFLEVVDPASPSRIAIYLDERQGLAFEIIERSGTPHVIRTTPGRTTFSPHEFFALVCEFGSSESFTLMQLRINDRLVAELRFPYHVAVSATLDLEGAFSILGTGGKENGGTFYVRELLILSGIMPFRDRMQLARYFFQKHFAEDMTPLPGKAVEFHPKAGMSTGEWGRNMEALAEDRRPTFRDGPWTR